MKIAYLITAHNQPVHLHRLIHALSTENTTFFVHIDRRSDIDEFLKFDFPENVIFIDERVRIIHGGFALVQAMINLMNKALTVDVFDYCQFLSGWDYPIKNNQFIFDFLYQHYPMNFMNFYKLTGNADFVENITKFHMIDTIGLAPGFLQKPFKGIQFLMGKLPYNRPFIETMIPYRGSAWFCLNKATIYYIIDFLNTERGRRFYEYFRWVKCADEIFFQTIVMNSPFAEYCRFYNRDIKFPLKNENHAYLHYIDWNQNRENPAVFDMNDLSTLLNCEALYARKFAEQKSTPLLDAIDDSIGLTKKLAGRITRMNQNTQIPV